MSTYCTVKEMLEDIERAGVKAWKEPGAFRWIEAASQFIDERLGNFIPVTETRYFDGLGKPDLFVDPLLAITTLTQDTTTIASTQFVLYPRRRHWADGPYTRLTVDPDAVSLSVWTCERDVIALAGRWGMYERTVALAAIVASQTDSATSLVVDRADAISPGAMLLIGTEQEQVTATGDPTDSTANTAEAVDASEEEIDLTDASLIYAGEVIRIDFEQMLVLDKLSNTALVARGYNGTKRATHTTAADVYVYRTFTVERGVNGTTAAAHTDAAISRYVAPADVAYLCRQIAALMLKKAEGGFAGKVGNAELGEVFYTAEFPGGPLKDIERNYRIVRL